MSSTREAASVVKARKAIDTLTVGDVAAALRVTELTIYNWIAAGYIPAPVRLGATGKPRVRWRVPTIKKWLIRKETEALLSSSSVKQHSSASHTSTPQSAAKTLIGATQG